MASNPRAPAGDTSGLGRPRDPGVDRRVLRAAAEVFGESGWGSFTVDAVARRAGVGKASIYLRWPNKEALLSDALAALVGRVSDIDTGSVRHDLVRLAEQMLKSYFGVSGRATVRLMLEASRIPGVSHTLERLRESQVLAARAIVRRGIARAELREDASVTLLLDAICGGCLNHVLATPEHLRDEVGARLAEYAGELVDFVLGSVVSSAGSAPPARRSSE
ncbi:transcriptional regulator [Saccharomonospora marina XMU15]|uniref:Transcriptional regulator n=1 Tax=Saccharomonospora marina XMU15 TaxID=882083 RepID=H5X6P8_9PSEU|nr:TetR/AcrR family transcriptional regulator [Saccharomonospora marina]EHR51269.1 transcriptional regulator [Saccharomonospora marina XMU15]